MTSKEQQQTFLDLSAVLTAFSPVELLGTGVANEYCDQLFEILGNEFASNYLARAEQILSDAKSPEEVEEQIRSQLIENEKYGPVTLNIVRLWYVATWRQLPDEWRARFGKAELDKTRVISAAAYQEGLVWDAIGAHPMGAKQPGFGTWSHPPLSAETGP